MRLTLKSAFFSLPAMLGTCLRSLVGCMSMLLIPFAASAQSGLIIDQSGFVGIGTDFPERQLHLSGNATFRMDRDRDSAAFILVRTDSVGNPLKTYVVGVNASGVDDGEFVINDLGAALSGGGTRRLTITDAGDARFTGRVQAAELVQTSSIRYKESVAPVSDASESLAALQGVRFVWKENQRSSIGLIAEEVASVLPELVTRDQQTGLVEGINYAGITALMLDVVNDQRTQIEEQEARIVAYEEQTRGLLKRVDRLEQARVDAP